MNTPHCIDSRRRRPPTRHARRSRFVIASYILIAQIFVSLPCLGQVTSSFTEPFTISELAAGEPGVVTEVLIVEGQEVSAGEVIAKLNHNELKQTLKLAELRSQSTSRINSAAAMLAIRKRQKESIEPLLEAGHANPAEVEKAVSELEVASAEAEIAKEESIASHIEVERIRAKIERRFIRSPIDGVISEVHRHAGEYIAATAPRFATVVNLDLLRVRFYLTESMIKGLNLGDVIELRVGSEKTAVNGTVEFISPVTDPRSGTARVDVVIDNSDRSVRSGTPCCWPVDMHATASNDNGSSTFSHRPTSHQK